MGDSANLVLVGGGGHGVVVAEAALLAGYELVGFLDDDSAAALAVGAMREGWLGSLAKTDVLKKHNWILGLGNLALRRRLIDKLAAGHGPASILHPAASVSPSAEIAEGAYVGPGSVVHARAWVSEHAIINSGAIVEHDCRIGQNVHVAPGAVLGGGVHVGADSLVGLGSRILPNIHIGPGAVVGAGAVVVEDVAADECVMGVPAQVAPREVRAR